MSERGASPRQRRVAQGIRSVLAEMIDQRISDPRVRDAGMASVNHVDVSPDLSFARVYVSFWQLNESETAKADRAIAALQAAEGLFRGTLGRTLKLRRAPSLRFVRDDSPAFSQRITELLREDAARGEPEPEQAASEDVPHHPPAPGSEPRDPDKPLD